eukprot:GGOE01061042.1.p1 GENE.GGOE01061042.1~~GGOE01061042.1.p1  ORF type:complete len:190 (+),score=51.24 GGOE01061042.1:31-600(+)
MEDLFEAKHATPQKGKAVFFGDSDVAYWPDLEVDFPTLQPLKCGIPGATMADVVAFAPRLVEKYAPSLIVCVAGENDIGQGETPATVVMYFQQFLDLLSNKLPLTRLFYISTKNEPATAELQRQYRKLNDMVRVLTSSHAQLTFIDCYSAMQDRAGRPLPALFASDGLHLSREGYDVWVRLLREALSTA